MPWQEAPITVKSAVKSRNRGSTWSLNSPIPFNGTSTAHESNSSAVSETMTFTTKELGLFLKMTTIDCPEVAHEKLKDSFHGNIAHADDPV